MTRRPVAAAALALACAFSAGSAAAQAVDMDRFDGRWFEIARNPNNMQRDCSRAQIDFNPGSRADRYSIVVTCTRRPSGNVETLRANASVTDTTTNAKFRFSLAAPRVTPRVVSGRLKTSSR